MTAPYSGDGTYAPSASAAQSFMPTGPIMFTGLNIYCEDCSFVQFGPTSRPAGVTKVGAMYPGDDDYAASSAPAQPLTVVKATTTTVLALSTAKVRYGHEQAERLTVRVNPQYKGVPVGKVAIVTGRLTLCLVSITSGHGSCALTAKKLGTGTYHLAAVYHGDTDFAASTSAGHTLIITR